jgi:hypothetical protein
VVAAGEADVFEVVMLASGAHALLRRDGAAVVALLGAEEDILELIHPGVGEEQRGIVGRHQRRRVNAAVPLAFKKPEKIFANLASGPVFHNSKVYQRERTIPATEARDPPVPPLIRSAASRL